MRMFTVEKEGTHHVVATRAGDCQARWTQLALIALVEVLAMSLWFSASAIVPSLRVSWNMSSGTAAWITVSVQVGFVIGAVGSAALNLADRLPVERLISGAALIAAGATVAFGLFANGIALAIPLRVLTGTCLALVYPTGMKLVASWFKTGRGLAIGIMVGALSIGSGSPHLLNTLNTVGWRNVLYAASGLAVLGAAISTVFVRPGPFQTITPPLAPRYALHVVRDRAQRLVNFGYFGHMWELYAFWTWMPAYTTASYLAWVPHRSTRTFVEVTAFATISGAGFLGCLIGGRLSDRYGRAKVTIWSMAISGSCCIASAGAFGGSPFILLLLLIVWGATVVADSAQFSTSLSELTDRRYIGTALTLQTAVGFLITVASIRLLPVWESILGGWQFAFLLLALGPLFGALSMARGLAVGAFRSSVVQPHVTET